MDRGSGKTDLVVTIDVQMSETAQQSDYVLPEVTYLERLELPEFVGGKKHYVGMRTVALEKIHPETRTCDEIFNAWRKRAAWASISSSPPRIGLRRSWQPWACRLTR